MMRKGDLREYPVEWVLRAAAEERLSGGIEFHTGSVACVHLDDGDVYLASAEGDEVPGLADDLDDEAVAAEEERWQSRTVAVVRALLAVDDGWYFFHPLHDHPLRGEWRWEVADVLAAARPRPAAVPPLGAPEPSPAPAAAEPEPPGTVMFGEVGPGRPLTDDEWAVLRAVAAPVERDELARRLGWSRERLELALAPLVGPPGPSDGPAVADGDRPEAAAARGRGRLRIRASRPAG